MTSEVDASIDQSINQSIDQTVIPPVDEYDPSLLDVEDTPIEVDLYGETDQSNNLNQSFNRANMEALLLSQSNPHSIKQSKKKSNESKDEEDVGHIHLSAMTFVTPTESETNTPRHQPINQSADLSIKSSNYQSKKQSVNQSINPSTQQSNKQSIRQSKIPSKTGSSYHSADASVRASSRGQAEIHSLDQSVLEMSLNQLLEQSINQSINTARSMDINQVDPPIEQSDEPILTPFDSPKHEKQEETKEQIQSINQSINDVINQSNNQSNNPTVKSPRYETISQSMISASQPRQSITVSQSIDQLPLDTEEFSECSKPLLYYKVAATLAAPLDQSDNQSNNQSVNQFSQKVSLKLKAQALECAINLAVNQSINQSINHLIDAGVLTEAMFLSCDSSPVIRILATCLINCLIVRSINKSSNQSIKQSNNQSDNQTINQSINHQLLKRAPRWLSDQIEQVRSNGAKILDQLINQSINQLIIVTNNQSMLAYLIDRLKMDSSFLARASILPIIRRTFKSPEARIVCRYHELASIMLDCLKDGSNNQSNNQTNKQSINLSNGFLIEPAASLTISQSTDQSINQSINQFLEQICLMIGEYALNKQDAQEMADLDTQSIKQSNNQSTFTGLLIGLIDHPSLPVARAATNALTFTTINQSIKKQSINQSILPVLNNKLHSITQLTSQSTNQSTSQFAVSLLLVLTNVAEVPVARAELSTNQSIIESLHQLIKQTNDQSIKQTAQNCLETIMWKP